MIPLDFIRSSNAAPPIRFYTNERLHGASGNKELGLGKMRARDNASFFAHVAGTVGL
jgi:hypothetical protein